MRLTIPHRATRARARALHARGGILQDPLARSLFILGLAVAMLVAGARIAEAQESRSDEVRNCVDVRGIDRTEVVDEDTLLFFMRNGDVYRNDFPNQCAALRFEETFMYRTAVSQLCDVDVITVLDDAGFGFLPLGSCALGKFQPIDEDAAEELLSTHSRSERRSQSQNEDGR